VANFVRRLNTRIGKYKGKIPLIFFNCDGVGDFSNKLPYKKNKINEEEMTLKKIQKGRRNKNKFFKKSLFTKEDNSSSNKYQSNNNDTERVIFMEIE
jgi:hypothetical protein